MKTEKFSVSGLDVELSFSDDLKVKRPKIGGLLDFPCSCGFETLKVETEDVENASGKGELRNLWPQLIEAERLTKEWNRIHESAKDFVDYFTRLYDFKGRYPQTWTSIRQGGFTTTFRVQCSTCGRRYDFGLGVSKPETPEPELTPLGAFQRFGIRSKKVEKILAKWIAENERREDFWKTSAEYINYVLSLEPSIDYVKGFVQRVKEMIAKDPPNLKHAADWVADFKDSLDELEKDFEQVTRERLEKGLQHIEDCIPKPKEYRLHIGLTAARHLENLPPLTSKDIYG